MSRIDGYEHERRRQKRYGRAPSYHKPRVDARKVKGQMALFGAAPEKKPDDGGKPFNDDIPF